MRLKFLKSGSKLAEKGAFPLLYPYGDEHEPYDMDIYVANKGNRGRNANEGSSSGGGGGRGASRGETTNERNVKKMTWAENAKRRLYTDNMLLNCGPLLQMWVLRTMTNIEDVRLQFLEREQRSRITPYYPALTKMFRAHINVELTQGGGAVACREPRTVKLLRMTRGGCVLRRRCAGDGPLPFVKDRY